MNRGGHGLARPAYRSWSLFPIAGVFLGLHRRRGAWRPNRSAQVNTKSQRRRTERGSGSRFRDKHRRAVLLTKWLQPRALGGCAREARSDQESVDHAPRKSSESSCAWVRKIITSGRSHYGVPRLLSRSAQERMSRKTQGDNPIVALASPCLGCSP